MKERSVLGSLVSGKSAKDQNDGPWNLGFPPHSSHSLMFSVFSCACKEPEMLFHVRIGRVTMDATVEYEKQD